ncbi:MAG TPA: magnesium chelatase domain-containing protein, partial [Promineifilum sp.]|nr:magnesium chelatase domain-containing protein [Promineifilum sp.]
KLGILKQFLIPRQIEQHGLTRKNIQFEEEALQVLIREYTREAGVRNLEREVATIARKIARMVAERKRYPRQITAEKVRDLLGPPRFIEDIRLDEDEVGVATGAAWTAAGGELMTIEVNTMPGKGNLILTGQLGEVMRESAQAALTYTRSQVEVLGIDPERFERRDIHIHLPEGAVPKDGPSAGVTLALALISAFTERPIRHDVAMTGEITLRGRVLPVGGVREKALAARRAGIRTFILPRKNERDLMEIPKHLRQDMKFVLVDRIDDVVKVVLQPSDGGQREP